MNTSRAYLNNSNTTIEEILNSGSSRNKMSVPLLAQLRNFTEAIIFIFYEKDHKIQLQYSYENIKQSLKYIRSKSKYKLLSKFHSLLQISTSHYTLDSNNSERLMLKYKEFLYDIKQFVLNNLKIRILNNLHLFSTNEDKTFQEYYSKIAYEILSCKGDNEFTKFEDRFYVEKIKPFFVDKAIYYEVTLSPSNDHRSKFDRLIVFSRFKIASNYAIKASFFEKSIMMLGLKIPIKIVSNWMISIRPCEINNFSKYFRMNLNFKSETKEHFEIMKFLTQNNLNLLDIATANDEEYQNIYDTIHVNKRMNDTLFKILSKCRKIIIPNKPGTNILRYLLFTMNNRIIKDQYFPDSNPKLSNLSIGVYSIPFDEMPFCTSLKNHNLKLSDLFECIPVENRMHELLTRKIRNNTEKEAKLYTSLDELNEFSNIQDLIKRYNGLLYAGHFFRQLINERNQVYILQYETQTIRILNKIISFSKSGIDQYTNYVESWLEAESNNIDDPIKKEIIKKMFAHSNVAAIYGSAGTGKSTLINHISNLFKESNKLFLANTNAALENLRKRVSAPYCTFSTIAKNINNVQTTDILFIDESSIVSNADMLRILEKNEYKLLVVVGDVYQIESILYGNWFSLIQKFLPNCCHELYTPYRTTDTNLLNFWKQVRENNDQIVEHLSRSGFSRSLDSTIFERVEIDEIILCLNYDGLYGINNINRLLQIQNKNETHRWGIWTYKEGDPVIFNETERFPNVIHNNLKGVICKIIRNPDNIYFEIEIDKAISSFNLDVGLKLLQTQNNKSIIGFSVSKPSNTDNDDESGFLSTVPFQISYAISIHKAQGLEYDSVKLIITSEVEEKIFLNIFYTAITRARRNLTIYWSPETQQSVIEAFKFRDIGKDYNIIKSKMIL